MKKKVIIRINPNIVLSVLLILGVAFSIIQVVKSAAQNPGHAWSTLDDTAAPLTKGGTGETAANNAFNALVPSQTGNSGKFLKTDASNTSWNTATGALTTTTRIILSGRSAGSHNADTYCHPFGSVCTASEATLGIKIPFETNIKNLYAYMSAAQGSGDTCNFYVRKAIGGCTAAFNNTTLTCSIANVSQACSDVTNTVGIAAGDCLQIYFDEAGGTCVGLLSWSFEAQY